jgi:hypothetical protein
VLIRNFETCRILEGFCGRVKIAHSGWYAGVVGVHVAAVSANLPPETAVQLQRQGEIRDWWETAVALQKMCQMQRLFV